MKMIGIDCPSVYLVSHSCCLKAPRVHHFGHSSLDRLRHIFTFSVLSLSCNTLPSRRTLKNSRLVCKKDDVHVCIMCLRAIMNYQVGKASAPSSV